MRPQPSSGLQRGSSLVEVLVAMLLMSFGVLAMTSLQAHAIQHSHTTDTRARATLLGHDLADRMRANVSPSGDWSAYELTALATSSITSTVSPSLSPLAVSSSSVVGAAGRVGTACCGAGGTSSSDTV